MYLKRNKIEKFWPIPRKGTKYVAAPAHNQKHAISLIVVMRDILKILKTKKELKKVINEKQILVNNKIIREINYPICLFDKISIPNFKKNYRATLSKHKKIIFEEISDKEAETKIFKVIGKKILGSKKLQLNLLHGKNLLTKEDVNTEDSVVFNFKENKIAKVLSMKKGQEVLVTKGKHAGHKGKIEDIILRGGKKLIKIDSEKEKINVWIKNVIAAE